MLVAHLILIILSRFLSFFCSFILNEFVCLWCTFSHHNIGSSSHSWYIKGKRVQIRKNIEHNHNLIQSYSIHSSLISSSTHKSCTVLFCFSFSYTTITLTVIINDITKNQCHSYSIQSLSSSCSVCCCIFLKIDWLPGKPRKNFRQTRTRQASC